MRGDTSDVKKLKITLTSHTDNYWTGWVKGKVGRKTVNCSVKKFMPLVDELAIDTVLWHLRETLQDEYGEE